MALIACPECGREISDQAPACIHCGYSLKALTEEEKEHEAARLWAEQERRSRRRQSSPPSPPRSPALSPQAQSSSIPAESLPGRSGQSTERPSPGGDSQSLPSATHWRSGAQSTERVPKVIGAEDESARAKEPTPLWVKGFFALVAFVAAGALISVALDAARVSPPKPGPARTASFVPTIVRPSLATEAAVGGSHRLGRGAPRQRT